MLSQAPGARAVAGTAHTRHRSPGRQHICSLRPPGPGRLPEPLTLDIAPRGVNTYALSGPRGQGGCRNRSHLTSLPGASTHMLSQAPGARAVAGTAHTRHRSPGRQHICSLRPPRPGRLPEPLTLDIAPRGVDTYALSGPRGQGGCRNRSHLTSLPGASTHMLSQAPGARAVAGTAHT